MINNLLLNTNNIRDFDIEIGTQVAPPQSPLIRSRANSDLFHTSVDLFVPGRFRSNSLTSMYEFYEDRFEPQKPITRSNSVVENFTTDPGFNSLITDLFLEHIERTDLITPIAASLMLENIVNPRDMFSILRTKIRDIDFDLLDTIFEFEDNVDEGIDEDDYKWFVHTDLSDDNNSIAFRMYLDPNVTLNNLLGSYFLSAHLNGHETLNDEIYEIRDNNQGYLVGIETNPGPDFFDHVTAEFDWQLLLYTLNIYVCLCLFYIRGATTRQGMKDRFYYLLAHGIYPYLTLLWIFKFIRFLANNQGFLVGVETNPGPISFSLYQDTHNVLQAIILLYYVRITFIFFGGPHSLARLMARTQRIDKHTFVLFLAILWSLYFVDYLANNQGFLVGVETNPGPENSDFIIRHLKNKEKQLERKPNKRAQAQKIARTIAEVQKEQIKNHEIERRRNLTRRMAIELFEPEGLFDVGIDQESRNFLIQMTNDLKEAIPETVDLQLDFTTGFSRSVRSLFEYFKQVGGIIKDYISFALLALFDFIDTKYHAVLSILYGWFSDNDVPILHAESIVGHAFTLLAHKTYLSKYISVGDIKSLFSLLMDTKKTGDLAEDFIYKIYHFLCEIFNVICENLGFEVRIKNSFSPDDKLNSFFERVKSLEETKRNSIFSATEFECAVFCLQDDIENYLKQTELIPSRKERLMYLLTKLKPLVAYCEENINPNNGPRFEPLSILICGPSGVGKSTITQPLLLAVLSKIISKEIREPFLRNHNDYIKYRNNENEFWDGTKRSHLAIVYDDFGQQTDTKGSPNPDAFEIIRLCNTAPYHLHMSSIADKSKHYAQPKMVFATTNRNTLQFASIISNEAVIRRFNFKLLQVPKREYCTNPKVMNLFGRKLDMAKVRKDYPFDPEDIETYAPLDICEFHEWDFVDGCKAKSHKVYSFHELVDAMVKHYKESSSRSENMIKYHQYVKEKFMAESLQDAFVDIARNVDKEKIEKMAKLLGLGMTCLGLWKLFLHIGSHFIHIGPESPNTKTTSKEVKKNGKEKKGKNVRQVMKKFKAQAGATQSLAFLNSILSRNLYRLRANGKEFGYALFLEGRKFCYPNHFEQVVPTLFENEDDAHIVEFLSIKTGIVNFAIDWSSDYKSVDEADIDLTIAELPRHTCRAHRSIVEHFPHEETLANDTIIRSQFPVLRDGTLLVMDPLVTIGSNTKYHCGEIEYESNKLNYFAVSSPGDCGAPLISMDARFPNTILGFHTAGAAMGFFSNSSKPKACRGVMITQEAIKQSFTWLSDEDEVDVDVGFTEDFSVTFTGEGTPIPGFDVIGKAKQPRLSDKSKLTPSKLYGSLWPVITKPAKLSWFESEDGTIIKPLEKARSKYAHDELFVPDEIVDAVFPYVQDLILTSVADQPWKPRIFSYVEAIDGVDGVDHCNAVSRQTSAGYPFNLTKHPDGKRAYLGLGEKFDMNAPLAIELVDKVHNIIKQASRGKRLQHVYMDCLKDERRPIAKVDAGKTRQFMACPLDYLIAFKMYFGDFIRFICSNKIVNGIAVATDVYSDWTSLANYMLEVENALFTAGDYSSFDGKLRATLELRCLDIIEAYYYNSSYEEKRIRYVLFQDIINSFHISEGHIYEFHGGQASGNPITAVLNSMVNILMIYSAAYYNIKDTETFKEMEIGDLFKYSRVSTFGDDNIISYILKLWEAFDQANLTKAIGKLFDMEYTVESKDGRDLSRRKITEISFLKRTFRKEGNEYVAPLELAVIRETLNWERTTSPENDIYSRVEAALFELTLHGKKVFTSDAPVIIASCRSLLNYQPKGITYDLARNHNCGLNVF